MLKREMDKEKRKTTRNEVIALVRSNKRKTRHHSISFLVTTIPPCLWME